MQMIQLMGTPSMDQAVNLNGARPSGKPDSKAEFDLSKEALVPTRNGQNEEVDPSGQKAQLVALDLIAGLLPRPSIELKDLDFTVQVGNLQIEPADLVEGLKLAADPKTGVLDIHQVADWLQSKLGLTNDPAFADRLARSLEQAISGLSGKRDPGPQCIVTNLGLVPINEVVNGAKPAPFDSAPNAKVDSDPTGARPAGQVQIDTLWSRLVDLDGGSESLGTDTSADVAPNKSQTAPSIEAFSPGNRPVRVDPRQILDFLRKGGDVSSLALRPDNGAIDAEIQIVVKDGRVTVSRPSAEVLTPQNADDFAQRYAQLMGSRDRISAWNGQRPIEAGKADVIPELRRPYIYPTDADRLVELGAGNQASDELLPSVKPMTSANGASTGSFGSKDSDLLAAEFANELTDAVDDADPLTKTETARTEPSSHAMTARVDTARPIRISPQAEQAAIKGMRDVADAVQDIIASRRPSQVKVELTPPDFGVIEVSVSHSRERADIELRASDEAVRHALNTHRQELVQSIEGRGVTLGSLNVGQHQAGQGGEQTGDMRRDFQAAANLSSFESLTESTGATPQYRSLHKGTVDYAA